MKILDENFKSIKHNLNNLTSDHMLNLSIFCIVVLQVFLRSIIEID
jgi:hypothetical protein